MWDYRFGGTDADRFTTFKQCADSGFILAGWSISGIGGDKTEDTIAGVDYWLVKTDKNGIKQWDKDFGGPGYEYPFSVEQTADGGFILGGYSTSLTGGDKTQPSWGSYDYWVIKTDSTGNIQWDKDFGGTNEDFLTTVHQTSDGGFIFGGSSNSRISGDKTQDIWDTICFPLCTSDYWIVKTDSLGNMQWDKDFGGKEADELTDIYQTSDGGFLLGGHSSSGISGDKTQALWGVRDYWIVKIDSLGNKQWDKDFGGTDDDLLYSLLATDDGGYFLGGISLSGVSGNKTQSTWGGIDFWIIKIDSLGNMLWDKDFGGSMNEDDFGNITHSKDGGYLIAGTSYSNISGDKTENNLGAEQSWIVKIDSLGNKEWDKTLLTTTSFHDEVGLALQTKEGCFAMANVTNAGIGGDKSQPSQGTYDYWVIKFCDSTTFPIAALGASSSICPGTCVSLINLSLNAINYNWSFPGAMPDTSTAANPTNICYPTPGNYDVLLIASNAISSDTLLLTNYITVYPSPPPQSITQSGDTLFAIAGSTSYQWYFNTNIINGATDYFYVAPAGGDYNVVATDANGCEVEAAVFNVVAGLTPALSEGEGVTAFPNPVGDKVTIHKSRVTRETAVEISIYNVMGVLAVLPINIGTQTSNLNPYSYRDETSIDVSNLPSGLYYLEITSCGKAIRTKFVKQ